MRKIVAKICLILTIVIVIPVIALAVVLGLILDMIDSIGVSLREAGPTLKEFADKTASIWHAIDEG